jgi:hypothetical protein
MGILGLLSWLLPPLGLVVTIIGLVYGIPALKRTNKGLALSSVILCSIGLVASSLNMMVGAFLGATGQHQLVNRWMHKKPVIVHSVNAGRTL